MVERSDRAPLLDWEEIPSAEKPVGTVPVAAQVKDRLASPSNNRTSPGCSAQGWSSGPGGPTSSSCHSSVSPHIMNSKESRQAVTAVS
ncbi:hypothetical protein F7725_021881 [Dissostichus mawsoni]|uniref:Uncharacterized protein n=1 Tax=Dissostichus mawsoni TaxID=36200 RepID=A0A7J5ZCG0_DISMA|nr:hypothetical protein F7725_021881 [Dissostichus mawsoni]